ncbi:MAG: hypothetical protein ABSE62_08475 [Chthoniobacteraceae bacterium]|jgi:hypothetical protein
MKSPRLLVLLLIPILIAGCATIGHRDRQVLVEHGVPQGLIQKMGNGDPLYLQDIIVLSQCGVPSDLIIHYIDETDTAYRLGKADVARLRSAGVSDDVISYMLSTSAPQAYGPGSNAPPPYPYPYYPYNYYYGGAYYGPVVVAGGYHRWGGGGWGRRW